MKRPLNIKIALAAGWFAFCGCLIMYSGFVYDDWSVVAVGALEMIGVVGILVRWRWSQWLVYFLSVLVISLWLHRLVWSLQAGSSFEKYSIIAFIVFAAATVWSAATVRSFSGRAAERA